MAAMPEGGPTFDPWSAVINGSFRALGQAAAGGPSNAALWGGAASAHLDGAGWTVATGNAKAEGGTVSKSESNGGGAGAQPGMAAGLGTLGQTLAQPVSLAGLQVPSGALLGVLVVVVLIAKKRRA